MPIISKKTLAAGYTSVKTYFEVTVCYNQELKFYILIPTQFNDLINLFPIPQKDEFGISYLGKSQEKKVVTAFTEEACLQKMQKLLTFLIESNIAERKVIIVDFSQKKFNGYTRGNCNKETPKIGIELGLVYATEKSFGAEKSYKKQEVRKVNGEDFYEEIDRYHVSNCVVIDDTEANRDSLKRLYLLFANLSQQLSAFLANEKELIDFITSQATLQLA